MRANRRRTRRTATTPSSATRAALSATELAALTHQFDRLRRRVNLLGRRVQPGGDPTLWSRWSRAAGTTSSSLSPAITLLVV
jgi:hypothetical protein